MIGGLTRRSLISAVTAIEHVIAESASVRPAAGHDPAAEPALYLADQRVTAKDTEAREA